MKYIEIAIYEITFLTITFERKLQLMSNKKYKEGNFPRNFKFELVIFSPLIGVFVLVFVKIWTESFFPINFCERTIFNLPESRVSKANFILYIAKHLM